MPLQYFSAEIGAIQELIDLDVGKLTNSDAKIAFFKLLSLPLQSVCRWFNFHALSTQLNTLRVLKRIGGHWHTGGAGQATQVDGDKFVCMDQILAGDQCVIYSFSLAADWTFEDQMDLLGMFMFITLLKSSLYACYDAKFKRLPNICLWPHN